MTFSSSVESELIRGNTFTRPIKALQLITTLIVPIKTPISNEIAGNIHTRPKATPTLAAKNIASINKKPMITIKNRNINASKAIIDYCIHHNPLRKLS
jgi:hypothetical protein